MVLMMYISKYDLSFINFVNRKYRSYGVIFKCFDDYILWLYYDLFKENRDSYYGQLEEDMMKYSNGQTGSARDIEKRELSLESEILRTVNSFGNE